MSSLIEQAALRLEQLRQSGIAIPELITPVPSNNFRSFPDSALPGDAGPSDFAPASGAAPMARKDLGATSEVPSAAAAKPAAARPRSQAKSQKVELDLKALADNNIILPNSPRTLIADQFRVIKRPLISNAMGRGAAKINHGNLIMVTSALAGEGKSFTSVNLAMSIAAELDTTVMLVDADVARPSLPRMLGLPEGPGLLDLLDNSRDMSSVLLRTNIDQLTLLRSGTKHKRATEMLASEAMRQLLDDMAGRYPDRIIIFDSPPLLLTTESRALATNMGQIVVVVHAGKTLQSFVQQALATIENCPLKLMLLNQARADSQGAYGYGGYGQGYGHDAHEA